MKVENVFGVFDIETGNRVRFTYHNTVRQGIVEYVKLSKDGKFIVNLICGNTDNGFKSYRVDRMQSGIRVTQ